jgi:beta-glucanase (GH16 family)
MHLFEHWGNVRKLAETIFYATLLLTIAPPTFSEEGSALPSYALSSHAWRMISLPLDPGTSNTIQDIFADDIPGEYGTEWTIYAYDTEKKSYVEKALSDTLSIGIGYWIIQISGASVELDMPTGSSPIDQPTIPLQVVAPGNNVQWNLVGSPFLTPKKVSHLILSTSTGDCSEKGCSLADANKANIVADGLWKYTGETEPYIKLTGESELKSWNGYWYATLEGSSQLGPIEMTIADTTDTSILPPIEGNWQLTFSDEFDGSSLDPKKWRVGQNAIRMGGIAGNSGKQVVVRDGNLELIGEKSPVRFGGKDHEYTTGEVSSFKKFRQTYGYFEARIKVDGVKGTWPSFWTLPDRGNYGNSNLRKESYLRFKLTDISQTITSAQLKVKVKDIAYLFPDKNETSNITLHKLLDNNWDEGTLTWENKPAYDPAWIQQINGFSKEEEGKINSLLPGEDITIDVTAYVREQLALGKDVGFAMVDTFMSHVNVTLGSKESSDETEWPRLIIDGSEYFPSDDAYVKDGNDVAKNFGKEALLSVMDPWKMTSRIDTGGMEIDIMEALGVWGGKQVQHALHWDRYGPGHPKKEFDRVDITATSDNYHTYGMYWKEGLVEFYVDGIKTREFESTHITNVASYFIFSNQLGTWPHGMNEIPEDFAPSTMYIDYFRAWSGSALR